LDDTIPVRFQALGVGNSDFLYGIGRAHTDQGISVLINISY
jgi:hypothetical protein